MGIESQSGKISLHTDGYILMRVGDTTKKYRVMGKSGQIKNANTLKRVESILKKAFDHSPEELKEVKSLKGTKISKEGIAFLGMEARWEHTEDTKVLYAELTSLVQEIIKEPPVVNNPDREIHAEKLDKDPLVDRAKAKIKSAFKTIGDTFQWVYRKLKGIVDKMKFSFYQFSQRKTGATPEQINIGYALREAGLSDVRVNNDETSRKEIIDMLSGYSQSKDVTVDSKSIPVYNQLGVDIHRSIMHVGDKVFVKEQSLENVVAEIFNLTGNINATNLISRLFHQGFTSALVTKPMLAVSAKDRLSQQCKIEETDAIKNSNIYSVTINDGEITISNKYLAQVIDPNKDEDPPLGYQLTTRSITILLEELQVQSLENITADLFPSLTTEEYFSDLFLDRSTAIQAFKDAN